MQILNSATEKFWTYKCNGEKCVREHYNPTDRRNDKRIPFMSCAMICGEPNIWPMPTGKTSVSSRSLTLTSSKVAFHIDTKFPKVQQQLQSAFDIFVADLQAMESSSQTVTRDSNEGGDKTAEKGLDKQSEQSVAEEVQRDSRNCDIQKVIIRVAVTSVPDVYLHMDMDESYNLTVASE